MGGMKKKKGEIVRDFPLLYPHAESNRNRQNRNLKFYPLNYRGVMPKRETDCKDS